MRGKVDCLIESRESFTLSTYLSLISRTLSERERPLSMIVVSFRSLVGHAHWPLSGVHKGLLHPTYFNEYPWFYRPIKDFQTNYEEEWSWTVCWPRYDGSPVVMTLEYQGHCGLADRLSVSVVVLTDLLRICGPLCGGCFMSLKRQLILDIE